MNNSHNTIHVVAFDIPIPTNYGGVIDIYYKLTELQKQKIDIILHCYQYGGRTPSKELDKICKEVYYYKRKNNAYDFRSSIPYIVNSRKDKKLIQRLSQDNYPILFEGLHSCYYLDSPLIKDRVKIVRTHNIEHNYYLSLSKSEKNPLKKVYFRKEAKLLEHYEAILSHASSIAAISYNDHQYFSHKYKNVFVSSAFHPYENVETKEGKGSYALYHGSLEVNENHNAAMFLANAVFNDLPIKLIIAGNKPKKELINTVKKYPNIEIHSGLTIEQIHSLVENAQINILPTFQATGIKLKLLLALYKGRHCVVNTPMVEKTRLEELCHIADNPQDIKQLVLDLFDVEYISDEVEKKKDILYNNGFVNKYNAEILIQQLFR
jgi:hypothetical protein